MRKLGTFEGLRTGRCGWNGQNGKCDSEWWSGGRWREGSQGKAFGMNEDEDHQSSGPLGPVMMMSCGTKLWLKAVGMHPSQTALQKMKLSHPESM